MLTTNNSEKKKEKNKNKKENGLCGIAKKGKEKLPQHIKAHKDPKAYFWNRERMVEKGK